MIKSEIKNKNTYDIMVKRSQKNITRDSDSGASDTCSAVN